MGEGTRAEQAPSEPGTFDDLVRVLHRRHATLSPSHRAIAERVMNDPEGVAFMTVTEMATAVGVNESTVVRFATGLNLSGYPALVRLCRERLREQAQLLRRFDSLATAADGASDVRARTAGFDQANIARTFARIDQAAWEEIIGALADAPAVHVVGLRKCFAPAYLLSYLLTLVRDGVRTLTPGAGTLTDRVRQIRAGDTVVALSIHRYTADTVRAFRFAEGAGARTIALTDNPSSPLARHAGPTLYVDTTGVAVMRSVAAFTSVVQALATEVAARRGAHSRSALLTEESLLEEFAVYAPAADRPGGRS
jgi:DNA-binding MurR/RpiR family transcriptional regulator